MLASASARMLRSRTRVASSSRPQSFTTSPKGRLFTSRWAGGTARSTSAPPLPSGLAAGLRDHEGLQAPPAGLPAHAPRGGLPRPAPRRARRPARRAAAPAQPGAVVPRRRQGHNPYDFYARAQRMSMLLSDGVSRGRAEPRVVEVKAEMQSALDLLRSLRSSGVLAAEDRAAYALQTLAILVYEAPAYAVPDLRAAGMFASAAELYSEARRLVPGSTQNLMRLAGAYSEFNKTASVVIRGLIAKLDPHDDTTHVNLLTQLMLSGASEGKLEQELDAVESALSTDPEVCPLRLSRVLQKATPPAGHALHTLVRKRKDRATRTTGMHRYRPGQSWAQGPCRSSRVRPPFQC
ncbi:unnamed protein product [Prorocentrum cordatum]|uniref:Uncharacterized protein n=1 Tax=Prorocentrum cordatum TaxID=2364126 RepID=A0ABN9T8J0_9DINO|nr:unnamed protein product [Polarella glacialis]